MEFSVDINNLPSGKVQIAVFRSKHSPGYVLDYPTPKAARDVLQMLGLPPKQIDSYIELLAEIGPREVLHFTPQEISEDVLQAQGFRV